MHPVSVLTFGIFLAGYITARWDLVTRLYELAIFAWDHGVIVRISLLGILSVYRIVRLMIHPTNRLAPPKASLFFPFSS
jgi:phosphatidylinositol glycan class Q protein